ncbi:MAG: alpha/beta fold hydrolase [Candidatus Omnitrophica bacterium]|nr:alpha/beta fold hydrolase [Candidatus Omnitrophota bacterium]
MEDIICFYNKKKEKLYGILSYPESNSNKIGVVLLNTGLNYRVAWHRLNVKLARFLAAMGFTVLRFDTHGIGDSEGELKEGIITEHFNEIQKGYFAEDTVAAIEMIKQAKKINKIILVGLCGGALTAFFTALKVKCVEGIISIAGPVTLSSAKLREENNHLEEAALLSSYIFKMGSVKAWYKFLTGRSEYKKIGISIRASLKYLWNNIVNIELGRKITEQEHKGFLLNRDFIYAYQKYCVSQRKVLFIYADRDQATWEFNKIFRNRFIEKSNICKKFTEIHIIKNTNHIFSSEDSQKELFLLCSDWLTRITQNNA